MKTETNDVGLRYTKIALLNLTLIPPEKNMVFSGFDPPSFDGKNIIFYGSGQADEFREGLYGAALGTENQLRKYSDNKTAIDGLGGPPTSGRGKDRQAYYPWLTGKLSAASLSLLYPRPVVAGGRSYFFAARWEVDKAKNGLFAVDCQTGKVMTLLTNADDPLKNGQIGQPMAFEQAVYFCGSSSSGAGVFSIPNAGGKAALVFDMDRARMGNDYLDDIGNPQVSGPNVLCLYGSVAHTAATNGIYAHVIQDQFSFHKVLQSGDKIDGYTVMTSGDNFQREIVYKDNLLAFVGSLEKDGDYLDALMAVPSGQANPIIVALQGQQLPGGLGTIVQFPPDHVTPSVDGQKLAFIAGFDDPSGEERFGLFVWDAKTKSITKVICTGDRLFDSEFNLTMYAVLPFINNDSFRNNKLAALLTTSAAKDGDVTGAGIFLFDLA